jgi:hypothetical protein
MAISRIAVATLARLATLQEHRKPMSELVQFIVVAAFGGLCFGCGFLIAFIVTRNKWRDEMIKRGVARYNWKTGKWEWGEAPKEGQSRY